MVITLQKVENDPLVCKGSVPGFGFGHIFPGKCSMIMGRFRGEVFLVVTP